ncbi:MAG: hypothetical protein KJ666_07005 [Bacteroidetes bacterium]|nr:hypothetical protein [Bacteroidota bacterium]MBU2585599.1 hypothetical protein [Bacteroidota bacterium]
MNISKGSFGLGLNFFHTCLPVYIPKVCRQAINGRTKIFKTKITAESSFLSPGCIHLKEGNLFVHTADKQIVIENLQLEGKKRMDASEFLRGFRFENESNLKFD